MSLTKDENDELLRREYKRDSAKYRFIRSHFRINKMNDGMDWFPNLGCEDAEIFDKKIAALIKWNKK